MRFCVCFSIVFFLILGSSAAKAFDGKRKGFVLGGSLGLGLDSFTQTIDRGRSQIIGDRETKDALHTGFLIGVGFSEQMLLYYSYRMAWFGITNALDENVTIANGISGVGLSYYMNPREGVRSLPAVWDCLSGIPHLNPVVLVGLA